MPVRHQYLIAIALAALVGVMVVLIAFDYLADKNRRFASQPAEVVQTAGTGAALVYPQGMINPQNGATYCPVCRWQGICPLSGRCPNCRAQLVYPGASYRSNVQSPAAPAQTAALFWPPAPQIMVASPQPCVLACPQCNFRMACNPRMGVNGVRCPRCAADLLLADQLDGRQQNFAYFNTPVAGQATQQAAFAPGWGNGQGNNPYCPLPAQQMAPDNVTDTGQGNAPVFMLPPDPRITQAGATGFQQRPVWGAGNGR